MEEVVRLINFLNRIRDAVEPIINTKLTIELQMFNATPIAQFIYEHSNGERMGFAYSINELELSNIELLNFKAMLIIRTLIENN